MDKQLLKLAKLSRKEMEAFSQRTDLHEYNDDDLSCLCAISSWFFKRVAKHFGYDVKMFTATLGWGDHCWNVYDDTVIDLTFTQFRPDVKPVHITHVDSLDYEPDEEFPDFDNDEMASWIEVRSQKQLTGWHDQSPFFTEYKKALDKHFQSVIKQM